jgi:uncharacterized membrane protein
MLCLMSVLVLVPAVISGVRSGQPDARMWLMMNIFAIAFPVAILMYKLLFHFNG